MISPALPAELTIALDRALHGLSRNDAAARAASISQTYRDGGGSQAIRSATDALAYAAARMPATYAAVAACLNALNEVRPDFAPQTLLDLGAGPGTASWAAATAFASLRGFELIDANAALSALALELARDTRLAAMRYRRGEALALLAEAPAADLVIASYMINELNDARREKFADLAWRKTNDTLLIVEPGTPAGYQRVLALRRQLIAQGAHVIAPCPHDDECPLAAPDWCHFTQRLPRSRAHQHLKAAELPYEDEKFIYVTLTRAPPPQRPSRVLAQPELTKIAVTAKLCTAHGIVRAGAPRRDKPHYARFRKLSWGDAVFDE
ncbi:MAG: SAM-dependent methyltransferase [Rhodopseudomonas sp.]|uniref:small ribosomal subunit Rsm22 family protein n=1 Tax=Rhodopseudomonas sp. TaxID=1078 RepID=UPI0017FDD72C|nr:small ribosomal subunit Rsm22 family protein [Rhodopseudomonas sp.]NVN87306.1 SAM-dependent methyltransferase [Rhodopseudomonas sp.]